MSPVLQKLQKHLGKDYEIDGHSMSSPVTIKHSCGRSTAYPNAKALVAAKFPCSCLRLALAPFANPGVKEKEHVRFEVNVLGKSVAQVSRNHALSPSYVNSCVSELVTDTRVIACTQQVYSAYADKIAGYVKKMYPGLTYKKFNFSKGNGYNTPQPTSLKVLCHPANLVGSKTFTVTKLKKAIKLFEAKHGEVVWPETYQYEFKRVESSSKGLRVLGLDPGTANFGAFGGILHGTDSLTAIEPIVSQMIRTALKGFVGNDYQEALKTFTGTIDGLLELVDPDVILMERFQTRGLQGTTVELIGFMNGIVSARAASYAARKGKTIPVRLIIASQWKNNLNKHAPVGLEEMYEMLGHAKYHHRLDAMMIALYAMPTKESVYKYLTKDKAKNITGFVLKTQGQ